MGIDPGTRVSSYVVYDPVAGTITKFGCDVPNPEVLEAIDDMGQTVVVVVEMFNHMGDNFPVGKDVFTTVMWIGRFIQLHVATLELPHDADHEQFLVYRLALKMNICGKSTVRDSNVRQAIIDRFGGDEIAIGKKKTPGPLYGLKSHGWQAMAVALTYFDRETR